MISIVHGSETNDVNYIIIVTMIITTLITQYTDHKIQVQTVIHNQHKNYQIKNTKDGLSLLK